MYAFHNVHYFLFTARIEHCRRLVEHQNARKHRKYAGYRYALFLSARKPERRTLFVIGHTDAFKRPVHALAYLSRRKSEIFRTESHVVFYYRSDHLVVRVLKNDSDGTVHVHNIRIAFGRGVYAVDNYSAPVGYEQSVKQPRERTFAAAVCTHERDEIALRNRKGHPAKSGNLVFAVYVILIYGVLDAYDFSGCAFFHNLRSESAHKQSDKKFRDAAGSNLRRHLAYYIIDFHIPDR